MPKKSRVDGRCVVIDATEVWDYAVAVHEALRTMPRTAENMRARETLYQFRNLCAEAVSATHPKEEKTNHGS
jgi:hypothetical protein